MRIFQPQIDRKIKILQSGGALKTIFLKKKKGERDNITNFNVRKQVKMPISSTWLNTHVLLFHNFVKKSRDRAFPSPISQSALTMKYLDRSMKHKMAMTE